jgi:ABC-2 type transport system permease protein
MSTLALSVTDSFTMFRRTLRHMQRFPLMTVSSLFVPVLFLLLFVYVFGGELESGFPPGLSYVDYVVPGIIIMAVCAGAGQIAVSVTTDVQTGMIARLRSMAVSRGSVLTGHVVGSVLKIMISTVLVVGIAFLIGFRPDAGPAEWVAVAGMVALLATAVSWMSVPLGLISKTPAGSNSLSLIIQFLPFLSSTFARPESMPAGVRWFAENQPFTPVIETVRGLLMGDPVGDTGWIAVAWCVGLALLGYTWARRVFSRDPVT